MLSGATIGQTSVAAGTSITGTMINERFVVTGVPVTINGGLGEDTIVLNGTNIAGSTISNIERAEIGQHLESAAALGKCESTLQAQGHQ